MDCIANRGEPPRPMFDTTVIKIVGAVFHELSKTDFQGIFGHKAA